MYVIISNSESCTPCKVKHSRKPQNCIIGSNTCFLTSLAMFSLCIPSIFPDKGMHLSFLLHFFFHVRKEKCIAFCLSLLRKKPQKGFRCKIKYHRIFKPHWNNYRFVLCLNVLLVVMVFTTHQLIPQGTVYTQDKVSVCKFIFQMVVLVIRFFFFCLLVRSDGVFFFFF